MIHKTISVILWVSLACWFPSQCTKDLDNQEAKQQQFLK